MSLSELKKGDKAVIKRFSGGDIGVKGIRIGLCEGAVLSLKALLPGGPAVVVLGAQEIAIGRALADEIEVERI